MKTPKTTTKTTTTTDSPGEVVLCVEGLATFEAGKLLVVLVLFVGRGVLSVALGTVDCCLVACVGTVKVIGRLIACVGMGTVVVG